MSEMKKLSMEAIEYKAPKSRAGKTKEQKLLFSEDRFFPDALPLLASLTPALNLSAVFDDCHNYIYANEGFLKDKIFHEMVKLIVMKLHDEHSTRPVAQFGIIASEYADVLANRPGTFLLRMDDLYRAVRAEYPTLLTDERLKLQEQTLAYLVGRLQTISLTKTPGDVKGEAFQAFTYRHQRGGRGEFFTPHPIVRLAVEMLTPQPHEAIIDPACGSGGFLIQAISFLQRNCPGAVKGDYVQKYIRGIEFNPDVALSASIRLAFEGGTGTEVTCANALLENKSLDGTFDIILTNPPFGSKGKVEDRQVLKSYVLARKWNRNGEQAWSPTNMLLGGQSPDVLFMEKCVNLLRPGGRMAIVLPDGLLQNVSNSHIRFWTRLHTQVLAVVSIPQEAFIPYGTGIKTSLLLLQKLPVSKQMPCFMARIQKIGYDVKGQPIHRRDEGGRLMKTAAGNLVVDDDIDTIAQAYRKFREDGTLEQTSGVYAVSETAIASRLDAEYYQPDDCGMIEQLAEKGAKSLGEIATLLTESDSFRSTINDEIRYISISDVDFRTMQVVVQQEIKSHDAPSRATYRVLVGDIITAMAGASTGTSKHATALVTDDEDGAICSNGFAVVRDVHGVDPLFLLAYMRTAPFLRQVKRLMTGHAIPAISMEDLAKVLVPIPPIDEQETIARSVEAIQSMRRRALKAGDKLTQDTEQIIARSHGQGTISLRTTKTAAHL